MEHKNVINLNGFNDVLLMIFDDNNDKLDFSINFLRTGFMEQQIVRYD